MYKQLLFMAKRDFNNVVELYSFDAFVILEPNISYLKAWVSSWLKKADVEYLLDEKEARLEIINVKKAQKVSNKYSLNYLLSVTCKYFNISIDEIKMRLRKRNLVDARHTFLLLAIYYKHTWQESAEKVSLNYSIVYHAKDKMEIPDVKNAYEAILRRLEN